MLPFLARLMSVVLQLRFGRSEGRLSKVRPEGANHQPREGKAVRAGSNLPWARQPDDRGVPVLARIVSAAWSPLCLLSDKQRTQLGRSFFLSVGRFQNFGRQVRVGHGRRQVNLWSNNGGIGFDHAGFEPKDHSQAHYRGSDCKTDVLAHLSLQLKGGYEDLRRISVLLITECCFAAFSMAQAQASASLTL
jgi:hypothetical protein